MAQLHDSQASALQAIGTETVRAIRTAIRSLLEEKHLYQSIEVPATEIAAAHSLSLATARPNFERSTRSAAGWIWNVTKEQYLPFSSSPSTIHWSPPDAKVYCPTCKRVEAFNLVDCLNLLDVEDYQRDQAYSLMYRCQSCKGLPQTFLIRRSGARITLSGRIPMEQVVVPKAIPKQVTNYYSGAIIAHQSGQTLAGLFMLRTLCEQWARLFSDDEYADKAITAYMDSLPGDFRSRFPSIRKMYEELSVRLHSANADAELFEKVVEDLNLHFDARALFKLEAPVSGAN